MIATCLRVIEVPRLCSRDPRRLGALCHSKSSFAAAVATFASLYWEVA